MGAPTVNEKQIDPSREKKHRLESFVKDRVGKVNQALTWVSRVALEDSIGRKDTDGVDGVGVVLCEGHGGVDTMRVF